MPRAIEPDEFRPPPAYRVPWRVHHVYEKHPLITNVSAAATDFVRVFIDGAHVTVDTQLWGQMLPGETAELCLCDLDLEDVVVTIAWFRPETGVEYLWRFVL
ncbi:hypothetical protein [Microbacterium rhizomatis]|uniref:Uncharacterized protein n=1 Tax=Microbacterium rhizomatis TaxID=1631477 RepID=A0A5J5J687_9MICO|nr:hypothetical protein [Microbacterium rhizomatis]KAA9110293.1 hypothetical protein F6B43_00905 [Microbacterium rhizomatis]